MRRALVTGVGRRRGIGAALALGLAQDGWDLALSYWHPYDDRLGLGRSADDLDEIAAEVRDLGREVVLLPADLEQADVPAALVDRAAAHLGPLSGLAMSHCVVALTSDATAGNLPYGATKGALDRVVLAAAHELGHLGIVANVVNPGPVDTGWMDDGIREAVVRMTAAGRLGTPQDVADLVRFLFSDRGGWVNGQLLMSNGGFPKQ